MFNLSANHVCGFRFLYLYYTHIFIESQTETIEMEDTPTLAIKHKKDSSMVVGFNLLKEGKGDVFISAGNSGALLTGATLLVGRIKGVDRPALAGILPSYHKRLVLMDCGSNLHKCLLFTYAMP